MRNVIYLIFRLFSINFQIHQTSHLNWAILSTVVIFIRGGAELLSRGDYPQSSNRGCRERLSRPPIKQFPASRSPISCYLYLLNWQKFAFDHRENLVSFSRRINALVSSSSFLFFSRLGSYHFHDRPYFHPTTPSGAPPLLRDRVPFVASRFHSHVFFTTTVHMHSKVALWLPFCTFNYFCGSFQNWKSVFRNVLVVHCWSRLSA